MGYYKVNEIFPWLYSFADPQNVFCYLLVGEKKALLFDTAFGIGDLTEALREITHMPFTVVLGHGHVDHANGAPQFDEVWLHEDDFNLFHEHTSKQYRLNTANGLKNPPKEFNVDEYVNAKTKKINVLPVGHVFDLGGLHAEVIGMEGHTAGSVGLLVREKKVLLTSDAANQHIWMFLNESLPVHEYITMLRRVRTLDFDTFFVGHVDIPFDKSDMDKFIIVAENIDPEKSEPYSMFPELKPLLYQENGAGIVFSERTLRG